MALPQIQVVAFLSIQRRVATSERGSRFNNLHCLHKKHTANIKIRNIQQWKQHVKERSLRFANGEKNSSRSQNLKRDLKSFYHAYARNTSSSAVAKRPRDALCLSVYSLASIFTDTVLRSKVTDTRTVFIQNQLFIQTGNYSFLSPPVNGWHMKFAVCVSVSLYRTHLLWNCWTDFVEILYRDGGLSWTLHFAVLWRSTQASATGKNNATTTTIIIIIIKNECHSNIIVDRLQGCKVTIVKAKAQ